MSFELRLQGHAGLDMPANGPEEIAAVRQLAQRITLACHELGLSTPYITSIPYDWLREETPTDPASTS